MARSTTFADYSARMLRVLAHIETHLDSALTPADLASVAAFSPYHFQRIFRGMVGESVMEHLRRLRLERAAARLKFTERGITEIAFEAGYEVHEAFSRAFQRRFGRSPSEFRRQERPVDFPLCPDRVRYGGHGPVQFKPMNTNSILTVEICVRPEQQVAYVHHVGPYDQCGEAWSKLMQWAGANGHLGQSPRMIGICYDDPDITEASKVRYDACLTVSGFEPFGEIGRRVLPSGDYAVVRHLGPYTELGALYRALFGEWLPRSGREAANSPCLEEYWNDPESTAPEDLETDILLPLLAVNG